MDAPGEAIGAMGSTQLILAHPTDAHHQSAVYKGKRTKRLRPHSSFPPDSSAQDHHQEYGDDEESPATSLDLTEEEEEVANCLILLAQGHFSQPPPLPPPPVEQGYKYSSRRYLEAAATAGAGKVGYYVYQCKTCDRTFPTFQALGGHRASHKKPKSALFHHHHHHLAEDEQLMIRNNMPTSLSLQLSNRGLYNNKANKVHECSICGAEFTSGQALGGHMRRHRGPAVAATTTLCLTPAEYSDYQHQEQPNSKRSRNVRSLDLDLNLPAPEDHDQSKLVFASKQHPPPLVLSAPALVDCHY